jgi:hypothetical protein
MEKMACEENPWRKVKKKIEGGRPQQKPFWRKCGRHWMIVELEDSTLSKTLNKILENVRDDAAQKSKELKSKDW